jgi:integrase
MDGELLSCEQVALNIASWEKDFQGSAAPATKKAVRMDWKQYIEWCAKKGLIALPCSIDQLKDFLEDAIKDGKKGATINRYIYTIGLAHNAGLLANPVKHPHWKIKMKGLSRKLANKGGFAQSQAQPLSVDEVNRILETLGDSPTDLRDAALLCVASDTLCRESELVAIKIKDFEWQAKRKKWILAVPFSKTDQNGESLDKRYLSKVSMKRVEAWLQAAGITDGFVFRATAGRPRNDGKTDQAMQAQEVARIFRKRALNAGIENAGRISGHSTRVGTATDLASMGKSMPQIMLAGGWKSDRMVVRYIRKSTVGDDAMDDLRNKIPLSRK